MLVLRIKRVSQRTKYKTQIDGADSSHYIFLINEFMCLALRTQMTILIFHYNGAFGFSGGKLLYIL